MTAKILDFNTHQEILAPATLKVQNYLDQAKSWNKSASGVFVMFLNENGDPTHVGSTGAGLPIVLAALSSYMTKALKEIALNG